MVAGFFCLHILLSVFCVCHAELCENCDQVVIVSSNQSATYCGSPSKTQNVQPSLTLALQNISKQTCIFLMEDQVLSDYYSLTNVDGLSITGVKNGDRTSVSCLNETGFRFSQSKSISFSNLKLNGCGRNTTEMVKTAFLFTNIQNVSFNNVAISNSIGFAVILLNVSGDVVFHQVTVQNNTVATYGGGIFISQDGFEIKASIKVTNCLFSSNSNVRNYMLKFTPYSFGAGLVVVFGQASKNNTLKVDNTSFDSNQGLFGGGLLLRFLNDSCDNNASILNSNFTKNKAKLYGGGIDTYSDTKHKNFIQIVNCSLTKNAAKLGGAVSLYNEMFSKGMIKLRYCSISSNYGELGAGIYAEKVSVQTSAVVVSNNLRPWENPLSIGQGAIFAYFSNITFNSNNVISSNSITAITLDMSAMTVFGSLLITNNSGVYGGACALYQHSAIDIRNGSNVIFSYNKAYKGGAIFVQTTGPLYTSESFDELNGYKCFMKVFITGSNLSYVNNTSELNKGNDISASTLKRCINGVASDEEKLFRTFGTLNIVTNPINVTVNETEWSTKYPGESFSPSVQLKDETGKLVSDTIEITVNKTFFYAGLNSNMDVEMTGGVMNENEFSLKSENVYMEFKVNTKYCPFAYSYSNGTCVCNKKKNQGKGLICNLNGTVSIFRGLYADTNQDAVKNDKEATEMCPLDYCGYGDCKIETCLLNTNNDESICATNRKGYLCSKCIENTTLFFGSNNCKQCDGLNILHILCSLLFLFLIPFVIVCLCAICFNVCIYENWLHSCIYFYQVLKFLIGDTLNECSGLKTIVHLLSVDLLSANWSVLDFCFVKDWTMLDKLAIEYIFPVVMFMTLFVIGHCLNRPLTRLSNFVYKCFGHKNHHLLPLLPFILTLTYVDITRITFNLLQPVDFSGSNKPSRPFWYASIEYGQYPHHVYYIPLAAFFLVAVVSCPFMLVPKLRPRRLQNDLALVDAFCGKFKDNVYHQGFASFYFFARIVIISFGSFLTRRIDQYTAVTLSSILLLAVFASSFPFKDDGNNYFDSFVLFLHVVLGILQIGRFGFSLNDMKGVEDAIVYISFLPALIVFIRCFYRLIRWTKFRRDNRQENELTPLLNSSVPIVNS